jgi:hypothetical protein
MYSIVPNAYWWVHALNAAIQPVIQLGIGYTQAVLGGRFESSTPEQTVSNSIQKATKKKTGRPTIDWWRSTYRQMNGERGQVTPERVLELVEAEWEQSISRTTAYNWRDECVKSFDTEKAVRDA